MYKNKLGEEVVCCTVDFHDDEDLFLDLVSNIENHTQLSTMLSELLTCYYNLQEEHEDLFADLLRVQDIVKQHG